MKINEKKRLKSVRRRIFYRLETSADVKRHQNMSKNIKKHQKASADENLTNATKHFIQFYYNYFFNHKRELFFLRCKKKKKKFHTSCLVYK